MEKYHHCQHHTLTSEDIQDTKDVQGYAQININVSIDVVDKTTLDVLKRNITTCLVDNTLILDKMH